MGMTEIKERLGAALPGGTREALEDFATNGYAPGGFVTAVLENDFMGAFSRADTSNLKAMEAIARYVYNVTPAEAWGSKEAVSAWIELGGLEGKKRKAAAEEEARRLSEAEAHALGFEAF